MAKLSREQMREYQRLRRQKLKPIEHSETTTYLSILEKNPVARRLWEDRRKYLLGF